MEKPGPYISDRAYSRAHDFAVISFTQSLPQSIPIVPVSISRMAQGAEVFVAGSGCEESVHIPPAARRLKVASLRVEEVEDLSVPAWSNISAPIWPSAAWRDYAERTFATPGVNHPTLGAEAASICPGDSGGPVLHEGPDGQLRLAGVHSSYAFEGGLGVSVWNYHTRLHLFGDALRSLGVRVMED